MNKKLIIIGAAAVAISGVLAYRYFVPPALVFVSLNPDHSGDAKFGGVVNHFSPDKQYVQSGRNGWDLEVKGDGQGNVVFNLLKNGQFKKQLTTK